MGLFSGFMSGGQSTLADWNNDEAVATAKNLKVPSLDELKISLEDAVYRGDITPEQAQVALQERTAMDDVSTDPRLKQAQMAALNELQDISTNGGLRASDKAQLNAIANEEMSREKGQREAIMQNAQARGISGSGMELASQMANQQAAASNTAQRDMDVAAQAQDRALNAIMQSGQLGGDMRNQDFGEQSAKAKAKDAMSQFNASNQNRNNEFNTNARNSANLRNANMRQDISNANTQTHNNQAEWNSNAVAKKFGMDQSKANGLTTAYSNSAAHNMAAGEKEKSSMGTFVSAFGKSDERAKKDIAKFDAADFLDSLTGYSYKYKNPEKDGEGRHASPMAQDLEKTETGKAMVKETPDGKMVDYGKGFGAILASLVDVHERVKGLEGPKKKKESK